MKNLTDIIKIVSDATGIPVTEIAGNSRQANIVKARHLSMWAYRWHSKLSLQIIAKIHGKNNHATVIWADTQVSILKQQDKRFNELCNQIVSIIKNK